MTALSLLSLIAAVFCYAVHELHAHSKLKWGKDDRSFWGFDSYLRKYKVKDGRELILGKGWYYRFFKIKYKERFPLSATLLVSFTDGYHLSQMFFKIFLALSFVPLTGWIWAGVIWVTFGLTFTIFYKLFSR